ncbi:hypothetical protein [Oceanobacillus neutriphilus]|uniref:DUF1642 domain-containing protein n=1 Tax=Oceanobacillus neutriphilus TaxID=531815 RepID=A0ABQ2P3H0_9BACI|nr:hypothetical protein [Oceanobacillus neutriphilus]GGP17168.1 hypothetical protein GCM10011346_52020 [Oceanobacillus neutriphilus]
MEKIQVTQKQADWLERYELTQEQIDHYINIQPYKKRPDSPIVDWDAGKLARALYVGYEVIPRYKAGEWLFILKEAMHTGKDEIRQIIDVQNGVIDLEDNWCIRADSIHIRHAAPEEEQQEKKRRFWSKLGREEDGWKEGDIVGVEGSKFITYISYEDLDRGEVEFPRFTAGDNEYFPLNKIRLVTPVEQRLDK